jgi:hypothetical protein
MKTVPLHGKKAAGRVVLVDDEDYDLVMQFRWFITERERDGRFHGPYAHTRAWLGECYRGLKMHILITGWPMVDHKDHDGLNNQRANLRPATVTQNQQNTRSRLGSTSRFKGICWNRGRGKWLVQIGIDGRNRYLGQSHDEEDAARMYDRAAWAAFGEFAVLNFPEEYSPLLRGEDPVMFPNRDGWIPSIKPLRPGCKKCGGPLRIVSKTGICTRNPECAAENKRAHSARLRARNEAA